MNIESLIEEFRERTDDRLEPYFWSDEVLIRWFAQAEAEATTRADILSDSDVLDVAAGEPFVDLPTSLVRIEYAELRDGDLGYVLAARSCGDLDGEASGWRTRSDLPRAFVHEHGRLRLSAVPDRAYGLYLDFFRTPLVPVSSLGSVPEIAPIHHLALLDWVLFLAYSKPDAETFDKGKASLAEASFMRYFGRRANADHRRRQKSNTPHKNRIHP